MSNVVISDSIKYIGADDTTLDLFESQYQIPHGVSYNSYVILDEKIAVMDTIDARKLGLILPIGHTIPLVGAAQHLDPGPLLLQ